MNIQCPETKNTSERSPLDMGEHRSFASFWREKGEKERKRHREFSAKTDGPSVTLGAREQRLVTDTSAWIANPFSYCDPRPTICLNSVIEPTARSSTISRQVCASTPVESGREV